MAQWSAFRPLTSAGAIRPDMLPAEGFQLSWYLQWLLDPEEFGGGYTKHRGFWRWQVKGPDGVVLFDSRVDIYGNAVWLPGTAGLAVWYIQINSANPKVVTTVPIRPAIEGVPSDATSWHQRSDGTWQNDVEQGYIGEEGWVAGAGGYGNNNEFEVYSVWFSARYMIPLPEGATIHLHQGAGGEMFEIPRLYRCQISTVDARDRFGTMYDGPGFHRVVVPGTRSTSQLYSADLRNYHSRRLVKPLDKVTVAKELTNTLVVCGQWGQVGWIVARSDDDGITWREGYELAFDATYSDCRMVIARDGAAVVIARKANVAYCRSSRDGYAVMGKIGAAASALSLAIDQSTGTLMATDGKEVTFVSTDGGRTWTRQRWLTT